MTHDTNSATIRTPEDLADTAEVVARGRGISVNALVFDALRAELDAREAG
ncbi:MAG: hypothetical protein JOZ68_00590 [Acidimicrobiia bacterium]|nr:hypothetical protein [Acidimicrobiia bacterium]MBV9039471.1 hypothetical protein [Acidimicrobiia bacterium]